VEFQESLKDYFRGLLLTQIYAFSIAAIIFFVQILIQLLFDLFETRVVFVEFVQNIYWFGLLIYLISIPLAFFVFYSINFIFNTLRSDKELSK